MMTHHSPSRPSDFAICFFDEASVLQGNFAEMRSLCDWSEVFVTSVSGAVVASVPCESLDAAAAIVFARSCQIP